MRSPFLFLSALLPLLSARAAAQTAPQVRARGATWTAALPPGPYAVEQAETTALGCARMAWRDAAGDRVTLNACATSPKRPPKKWFIAERDALAESSTTVVSVRLNDAGDRSEMDLYVSRVVTVDGSGPVTRTGRSERCGYRARPGLAGGFAVLTICAADAGAYGRATVLADRIVTADHAEEPLAQLQGALDRLEAGDSGAFASAQRLLEASGPPAGIEPAAFAAAQDKVVALLEAAGRPADALRVLHARDAAAPGDPVRLHRIACLHVQTRELESAYEVLGRALRQAPPGTLPDPAIDPCFERVRTDPRFRAVLLPPAP